MTYDFKTLKTYISTDLSRIIEKHSFLYFIEKLMVNPSFKMTFWFRLGSYLKLKKNILWKFVYFIVFMIFRHYQFKTGIQLLLGTTVGKGLYFPHYSCIVINQNAIIGDYCTVFHGVTIGSVRGKGAPVIGNNVVIASGAKILGNVVVGNNVFIGANAVVVKDVPDNAIVGGVPAKILNYDGLEQTQYYFHSSFFIKHPA